MDDHEEAAKRSDAFAHLGVTHPRWVAGAMVAATLLVAAAAVVPTVAPKAIPFLPSIRVDTDPENMLRAEEPVRVFHHEMKRVLSLHDIVVVGVVNDEDPDGVFNPGSLARIDELTRFAATLRWPSADDPERIEGVVPQDIIAPSTVDNIEQAGPGAVRFEWLMPEPPTTREGALAVRDKARRIPFLEGTLVAEDGKALALYLPITSKDVSYEVYRRLQERIATFDGPERWHITGLPVAEDTFGVEMFHQMAVSAPLAMAVIFILMLYFFRRIVLIVAPMIIALVSVILTMGLLVATGNTIHIMSSMIPVFIMPIAVLDSIHILSEFFDRYPEIGDRRRTIEHVMRTLFAPMLYTSITSIAGFASLIVTPIPPVQVFGTFVAVGIAIAWLVTVTFVPAYIMLLPARALEGFGVRQVEGEAATPLARALLRFGPATARHAKPILGATLLAAGVAAWGISRIEINDNPVRWFARSHPIRVADDVLNRHFGGTYMAYLALRAPEGAETPGAFAARLADRLAARRAALVSSMPEAAEIFPVVEAEVRAIGDRDKSADAALRAVEDFVADGTDAADWDAAAVWEEASAVVAAERSAREVFKQPEALRYVEGLQRHLLTTGAVGKSNSLADIVKTVYRELLGGGADAFRVPDRADAVAQSLITYQSSHRPQDLWHFVTPDYRTTSLWVQMRSGDNRDMQRVVDAVDAYVAVNPPPAGVAAEWFGLTYINVVWQERMVTGMLESFAGSFLVVLAIMTALFRSIRWGALAMIPLTVTIALIYGVIGLVGKDYDMPVAVLSSLTLGLAVDFAIHFLARARALHATCASWESCLAQVFGEPARAIARNVIVIALGFTPLLAASLVPYQTVGFLMAAILAVSGFATLAILPALMAPLERFFFRKRGGAA